MSPRAFAEHFRDVAPERFNEKLSGIRGADLDAFKLEELATRIEMLLGGPVEARSGA